MPDIELRFHVDMLTMSAPIDAALERQGLDLARDLEYLLVSEPDVLQDALRVELLAGAQCLALPTRAMTPARLAHLNAADHLDDLAKRAVGLVRSTFEENSNPLLPQHLIVELGFCGLPLDASSKSSLNEHRDQYVRAGRAFEACDDFDAYLLSGFENATALKCALMGMRKVTDRPVLACVNAMGDGTLASGRGMLEDAASVAEEFGAAAFGFATEAALSDACALAKRCAEACGLPVIAELDARERIAGNPLNLPADNPYGSPDVLATAALSLRAAGAEILRAGGAATSAYTGALAAVSTGLTAPVRSAE